MHEVITYLLKSLLVSGTLTLYYWLFLRNRKFNVYNRYYLLAALAISIVLPLFNLRIYSISPSDDDFGARVIHVIQSNEQYLRSGFTWQFTWITAALLISAVLVAIFLAQIVKLLALAKKLSRRRLRGVNVFITDLDEAPFSFANNIFWKQDIDMNSEEGRLIFEHEMAHIRERHTYDKLFAELVARIFWMNPFYRMIRKEIGLVHEFIADEKAVGAGDTRMLAKILLKCHNAGKYLAIENSFFHSPVKRRMTMVASFNKTSCSYLRRICILPVALAMMFVCSISYTQAQTDSAKREDSARLRKLEAEHNHNPFAELEPNAHAAGEAEVKAMFTKVVTNPPANRVYFINGERVSIGKVKKLKYENTTDMLMLPPEDAIKKFGVTGEKGVIAFRTRK